MDKSFQKIDNLLHTIEKNNKETDSLLNEVLALICKIRLSEKDKTNSEQYAFELRIKAIREIALILEESRKLELDKTVKNIRNQLMGAESFLR